MKKVAIVCANGLGDGLLSSVLAQNFYLSGYETTLFSNALCGLKNWFPQHHILPFPQKEMYETTFSSFDKVIAADHSILVHQPVSQLPVVFLKEHDFDKKRTLVDNLAHISRTRFFLPYSQKENGIVIPPHLHHRKDKTRVILHPMSLDMKKCWPAEKFLFLARRLFSQGLKPIMCVSPSERKEWESQTTLYPELEFPLFQNLEELATYIYESGWMIGNDSGIGHLASNLGLPTLSLFARKSYSYLWRPGWGKGKVVTPTKVLIGGGLMNRHWKNLLSTAKVARAFKSLRKEWGE